MTKAELEAKVAELEAQLASGVSGDMTACQHIEAAYEHTMAACEMYGQAYPIDVERAKATALALVQSARKIDL